MVPEDFIEGNEYSNDDFIINISTRGDFIYTPQIDSPDYNGYISFIKITIETDENTRSQIFQFGLAQI